MAYDKANLKSHLELAGHIGAAILIVLYVSGFLVITFSDSSHGIVNFGFFRTRVLAAGTLFGVFLALPLWVWEGVFGLWGNPPFVEDLRKRCVVSEVRAQSYVLPLQVFMFFMWSWALSIFLSFFVLQQGRPERFGQQIGFSASSAILLVACFVLFPKHPFLSAALCCLLTVGGLAVAVIIIKTPTEWVFVWFLLLGFAAQSIKTGLEKTNYLREFNWHIVLFYLICIPGYFGVVLFEKIPSNLCGGKPTQAVFQFVNSSPIDGVSKNNLWLLDEGDSGYYVLRSPDERKGVFLPRASISAIYFDADEPKLPPSSSGVK